jgi:hypothetical protein
VLKHFSTTQQKTNLHQYKATFRVFSLFNAITQQRSGHNLWHRPKKLASIHAARLAAHGVLQAKSISRKQAHCIGGAYKMRLQDAKTFAKALNELSQSQKDLANTLKDTGRQAAVTKKLWREGNKSKLIKIGMALIVLPEPTPVSEIIGACFVAAGAIQKGIQSQSLYIEDIGKAFQNSLREVIATKYDLQV